MHVSLYFLTIWMGHHFSALPPLQNSNGNLLSEALYGGEFSMFDWNRRHLSRKRYEIGSWLL